MAHRPFSRTKDCTKGHSLGTVLLLRSRDSMVDHLIRLGTSLLTVL